MWITCPKNLDPILTKVFGDGLSTESCEEEQLQFGGRIISVNLKVIKTKDNGHKDNLSINVKLLRIIEDFGDSCKFDTLLRDEISMYGTILPAYKKFEMNSGLTENEVLNMAPIHYGSQLHSIDEVDFHEDYGRYIVLENLETQGYYKAYRKNGADLEHTTLVVEQMAKFHSVGIAMKHKNPKEFNILKEKPTSAEEKYPEDWVGVFENLFKLVKTDRTFSKHYDSFKKLYSEFEGSNMNCAPPEPWSSIVHGNLTILNVLFHRSQDTPQISIPDCVKFVDFEYQKFSCPLRELGFFLATSANQDVVTKHYDDLLNIYYDTLKKRLTIFGVDTELYSKESFQNQYRVNVRLIFLPCIVTLQMITFDIEIDHEDFGSIANKLQNFPYNEIYYKRLRDIFSLYYNHGWFD